LIIEVRFPFICKYNLPIYNLSYDFVKKYKRGSKRIKYESQNIEYPKLNIERREDKRKRILCHSNGQTYK